jgi:methionyl-tRNA synthetase
MRKILLTCALPYANGPLHVGHMFEHLYADFWTRFQKMRGHQVLFICADDTHGTPIMVEARKRGITPETLIDLAWKDHVGDLKGFQVEHTHYSSTNSQANKELCELFYGKMKEKNHLTIKSIQQLYCENDKMFLPDRFVKGECPKCGAKDQYGDSCDVCASTYTPADLKNSYCAVCGTPPVQKPSDQIMFKLNDFNDYLKSWLPAHTSKEVGNKMMEWFNEPLRDWDISRNAPYFGFQIPGHPDKYFYVWVDAPMGYVSSTKEYCDKNGLSFDEFWKSEKSEVYHLIGKDIVYFHTLFWPALLKSADFRTPTSVWVHGHILVNGEKMSKSKGTFLSARVYREHLDPMYLRYYFASKFSNGVDDVDFNLDDFTQRTNSDLIGKITNLASRGAQMLNTKMDGVISEPDAEGMKLLSMAQGKSEEIATYFENREFLKAINEIRALADEANRYFDEKAPWKTVESNPAGTKQVLSTTLNLFRMLAVYLKPILPLYTEKVEKLFGEKPYVWDSVKVILKNHKIQAYEHLATRIDPAKVKAMMDANKKELEEKAALDAKAGFVKGPASAASGVAAGKSAESASATGAADRNADRPAEISIDDFGKIDLRVAEIVDAEEIKEADKLLRLKVSLGPLGERQIIAGIKSAYKPEQLKGRMVIVVANLAPRKMKFGMSEGMVIAAGAGGSELFVLSPDAGAKAGDKVK